MQRERPKPIPERRNKSRRERPSSGFKCDIFQRSLQVGKKADPSLIVVDGEVWPMSSDSCSPVVAIRCHPLRKISPSCEGHYDQILVAREKHRIALWAEGEQL